jgi:hypothetical protein
MKLPSAAVALLLVFAVGPGDARLLGLGSRDRDQVQRDLQQQTCLAPYDQCKIGEGQPCVDGYQCEGDQWYAQCRPKPVPANKVAEWGTCTSDHLSCAEGLYCDVQNQWYAQCKLANTCGAAAPVVDPPVGGGATAAEIQAQAALAAQELANQAAAALAAQQEAQIAAQAALDQQAAIEAAAEAARQQFIAIEAEGAVAAASRAAAESASAQAAADAVAAQSLQGVTAISDAAAAAAVAAQQAAQEAATAQAAATQAATIAANIAGDKVAAAAALAAAAATDAAAAVAAAEAAAASALEAEAAALRAAQGVEIDIWSAPNRAMWDTAAGGVPMKIPVDVWTGDVGYCQPESLSLIPADMPCDARKNPNRLRHDSIAQKPVGWTFTAPAAGEWTGALSPEGMPFADGVEVLFAAPENARLTYNFYTEPNCQGTPVKMETDLIEWACLSSTECIWLARLETTNYACDTFKSSSGVDSMGNVCGGCAEISTK